MKYMGIDFGTKRIGISVSDERGAMAFPHSIVKNTPSASRELARLIEVLKVETIVCGHSLARDGSANSVDVPAKKFVTALFELTGVPVVFEWEGYSSGLVRSAHSAGKPRGVIARKSPKAEKAPVDAQAAMVILQSYLDKHKN